MSLSGKDAGDYYGQMGEAPVCFDGCLGSGNYSLLTIKEFENYTDSE